MPLITENDKNIYESYEWKSNIGQFGGFEYIKYNKEIVLKPIELSNIGEITKCNGNTVYLSQDKISGISQTTIELDNIPKGSYYGWDMNNKIWIYYINNIPSYYSNYIN